MDTIRVLRVLEYVGPRANVEKALAQNAVKGDQNFGLITVREAQLGQSAEAVDAGLQRKGRQKVVWDWGVRAFGTDQMTATTQRGARFAEEAIELAQAVGVQKDMLHKLVDFIYARDVGNIDQEIGGVGVTLLALCEAVGSQADECERNEIARVLAKPIEHFQKRNAEKNAAGFYAVKIDVPREPLPYWKSASPARGSSVGLAAARHIPGVKDTYGADGIPVHCERPLDRCEARGGVCPVCEPGSGYVAKAQAALDGDAKGVFVNEAWLPEGVVGIGAIQGTDSLRDDLERSKGEARNVTYSYTDAIKLKADNPHNLPAGLYEIKAVAP